MADKESGIYKRWIGRMFGYRVVINLDNNAAPERQKLEFRGVLLYDNPANSSTVVELAAISAAQHGNLGGGGLHTVATTSTAGFMSATDKTKLNDATPSATASKLVIRDADGDIAVRHVEATAFLLASPVTRARQVPLHWIFDPALWQVDPYTGGLSEVGGSTDMGSARVAGVNIDAETLPHGATLIGIKAWVFPTDDRGVDLPATYPRIGVRRFTFDGSLLGESLVVADPNDEIVAYTTPHEISILATVEDGVPIDRSTQRYVFFLEGEQGAGSYSGLRVYGVELSYVTNVVQ